MKKLKLKQNLVKLITILAFAGTVALSTDAQTKNQKSNSEPFRDRCGESTLRGGYGSNITGSFFLSPTAFVPIASVGRMVFDGSGNVAGTDTNSFNGAISRYPFTGTYVVNNDCTGTLEITLANGFVITNDIVIVDDGSEVNLVQTNPGTAATGVLKRQRNQ
jgi:hypothetical protein